MDSKICQQDFCTACGACENVCPKQAISMQEDEYGFMYPVIDESSCIHCDLCKKTCAEISDVQKNRYIKSLALQSKDINLIQKSSSGGMFAQLAKYVLSQNGVVFGCSMEKADKGFDIKHISIEDEKELYKLQGSKYVQSNIGYSYKQVKNFLGQNKFVLFSGTPCQIAGLKAYLNKDYDNLLCVDLSCTGVPSLKMFNDFIKHLEYKNKTNIIKFDFRNKQKMGWTCGNAFVTYANGKQKILCNDLYAYLSLFINGGIHRDSCYNCQYVGLNRVSDITLADCWGIERNAAELLKSNDGSLIKENGISLVLINTDKGNKFLEKIKSNLIIEKIDVEKIKEYNGPLRNPLAICEYDKQYLEVYKNDGYSEVEKLYKSRLGKRYFYLIVKSITPQIIKNIIKLFIPKTNNKVDVLLMTWYFWRNYGSILTAYALYKVIKDFGYSVKVIQSLKPTGYAEFFAKKYFNQTEFCLNNKYFEKLNKIAKTFVVGADNQLDYGALGKEVFRNLLNFTDINSKKIIISGSFGSWNWNESKETMDILKNLYKRFDFISVRENIAKENLKEKFGIDSEWFIDPVFFLDKNEYVKLAEKSNLDYSNSIMSYILYPNEDADKIIQYLNKNNKYNIKKYDGNLNAPINEKDSSKTVENWLKSILTSKYIVTDSFHCVAFSIILNKSVICIKNKCDTSRFLSVFKKFNINIPIYTSFEDFIKNQDNMTEINWMEVNKNIANERNKVLEIIKKELSKNIIKSDEQKIAEQKFLEQRKTYYKNQDIYYRKNAFLYKLLIEPLFFPIIRFFKYRRVEK